MKLTTLKNGIKMVVVPVPGLKAVTIEVMVKIGAKYENKQEQGLSHFLEHLAFKGTVKRPTAGDIFREIDGLGASFDAETGYETTSYSLTTVNKNLPWATELLADLLTNSTMPDEEVAKERGVIMEEIKMYQDNPMMGLSSEMMKFLYGSSSIGCWNISGMVEDIKRVERDQIVKFRNKFLNPEEMVVVVAGDVKPDEESLVANYFEKLVKDTEVLPEVEMRLTSERVRQEKREVEQAHVAVAVPAFGSLDPRKHALRLLNIIMAGNASSRLFEEIRSKRGWAYYVFPIGETLLETGFWGVQAGVAKSNLESTIEVIKEQMTNLAATVTAQELNRAKEYLKGKVTLNLDQTEFWTGSVADKLLLEDELISPEEELEKVEQVKLEEVKAVAKEIFKIEAIRTLTVAK